MRFTGQSYSKTVPIPLWLLQVADQLPRSYQTLVGLLAAGRWMSAPQPVQIIHTAWKQAKLELQQQGANVDISRKLHA